MPWRVDQVESIVFSVFGAIDHGDRVALDRNATLPLQIHRIQQLFLHVAHLHGSGELEDSVRQCRLAVVHVGDDAEIASMVQVSHAVVNELKSRT